MQTIMINGTKYIIEAIETTEGAAIKYPKATADMERRGIVALLMVRRPNGRKVQIAYQTRNGYTF